MERFITAITADGSPTLFDSHWGETFKSRHAAHLESEEVFIRPGIIENPLYQEKKPFRILELGFGLATNCRALLHSVSLKTSFIYTAIEADLSGLKAMVESGASGNDRIWMEEILASGKALPRPGFVVEVVYDSFTNALAKKRGPFEAIFHDPFSPARNPEGWTEEIAQALFAELEPGGRLVTYSVSRTAKEIFAKAGFTLQKIRLPELLHKRESLLATKAGVFPQ